MNRSSFPVLSTSSAGASCPGPAQHPLSWCPPEADTYQMNAQASEPLEEWPVHRAPLLVDARGNRTQLKRSRHPRVKFSERSTLYVYQPDPLNAREKSYAKEDRRRFGLKTMADAKRIQGLISSAPGESTKDAFKHLLKNKIIRPEEMVGIEQLVMGKSPLRLSVERRDHTRAVLIEQQRQAESMGQDDAVEMLRLISARRSLKSAKCARIRAAMAA